ncbi:MAG: RHS repeat-associated core domain-containing protein [Acidimicrobiales bacterium]|nr:RHS repeat-associated core domain-containing protein [Acidimicrobiales bacterium]
MEHTYTAAGRLHQMIEAPTGVEVFDWVDGDQSAKRVTAYDYDDAGRLVSVTDPDGGVSRSTFDEAGRVVRADSAGDSYVRWELDAAGRPVAEYTPSPTGVGESVETWEYDAMDRVVEHAEPHDPAESASAPRSTFGYHPSGRLAWVRDPRQDEWSDRVEVSFDYDARGNLVSQRAWSNDDASDPDVWSEVVETWAWDLDDRLVAHTRPGGGTTGYGYAPATGWLSTLTHPSGRVESRQHWPGGSVREQRWSAPGVDEDVVVERWYDSLGRQTQVADPTGDTSYGWNRNGALVEVVGPQEHTTFGYDQHGHRIRVGYPWGFDAHYDLDSLGRPVALTQDGIERAGWDYDADGRVTAETIGPDGDGGTASWVFPDNGAHRPLEYRQQLAENPLRVYELGWDHAGRLVEQDRNGTVETFAYDPAGQLIERQRGGEQWSWTYNTRGLITHSASSTDAGDEARHTNFDADGQPVDGTSYWTNGWVVPTSFDHDPDGRLVEARLASTPVFAADYDPRGLPTEVTTHWDGEARTTERVYDGDRYLVSLDPGDGTKPVAWDRSRAAGPVLATQQWGDRDGLVSYLQGPTGAVGVHYGPVWLGGVNRDPNASNLNHYFLDGYDPWGNPEGTVAPARFGLGYRGELTIDGVIHLRNRDYHPGLHTFTSPDPLDGVPGTPTVANRYHYANNNPHSQIDPLGLRPDDASLAGIAVGQPDWYWELLASQNAMWNQWADSVAPIEFTPWNPATSMNLGSVPEPASSPSRCGPLAFACAFGSGVWDTARGTGELVWGLGQDHTECTIAMWTGGTCRPDTTTALVDGVVNFSPSDTWNDCAADGWYCAGTFAPVGGAGAAAIRRATRAAPNNPASRTPSAARIGDDVTAAADDAFTHGYSYHPRIRARGLQDPVSHNFPYSYDDVILRSTPVRQADGSLLYRTPGSINGKDGFFEIALNPDTGTIFHRTFVGG